MIVCTMSLQCTCLINYDYKAGSKKNCLQREKFCCKIKMPLSKQKVSLKVLITLIGHLLILVLKSIAIPHTTITYANYTVNISGCEQSFLVIVTKFVKPHSQETKNTKKVHALHNSCLACS